MKTLVDGHPGACAGQKLAEKLARYGEMPILLMLSGGSSFEILKHVPPESIDDRVTITVLDERYTDDPTKSNFGALLETAFCRRVEERGASFIDSRPESSETLQDSAARFEEGIRHWYKTYGEGVVLVTEGIGADGHTAGILPFPNDPERFATLFEAEIVCGYEVPSDINLHPRRLTVTLPFLRQRVTEAIVYVVGEEKREALRAVHAPEGTLHETPARIIREMRDVFLVTDISL